MGMPTMNYGEMWGLMYLLVSIYMRMVHKLGSFFSMKYKKMIAEVPHMDALVNFKG